MVPATLALRIVGLLKVRRKEAPAMAGADRMTIEEVVRKVLLDEHADVIREAVKAIAAELMELEVSELIGAEHGERRPQDRATHRNGYRARRWDTRAGEIELQIPKIRQGSYFPSILEPRRRSEQALLAVVQQAYVCGVSTRRVDQLVEILGLDVGEAETEAFWTDFLRALVARGLVGVQLAISDAHAGLKAAIAKVLGCAWQRCTVHFLRDCLGHARKDQHGLLGALIRPIFNADSLAQARDRLSEAVSHLDGRLGKIATMLEEAEPDILAFYAFPSSHWRKLRSTNPLERFNREVGRRTDVVGIFPDDRSLVRLAGMLCIEQNDEWLVGRGYLSAESIALVLTGPDDHTDKEIKEEVAQLQAA